MNNDFKRLQQLAGIKEITISDPTKLNINNLEIGDKLLVKYIDPLDIFLGFKVGEVWEVVEIDDDRSYYRLERNNSSIGFRGKNMKDLVNKGTFEYARGPEINEMVVKDPRTKNLIGDIILLDKKFIDKISKMPSDFNQTKLANDFYGKYEDYGIIDALDIDYDELREKLGNQQYKSLMNLYEELKLMMNKLPNIIDEMF
jgi:hypothetical protein